jgi:hypothetical protein
MRGHPHCAIWFCKAVGRIRWPCQQVLQTAQNGSQFCVLLRRWLEDNILLVRGWQARKQQSRSVDLPHSSQPSVVISRDIHHCHTPAMYFVQTGTQTVFLWRLYPQWVSRVTSDLLYVALASLLNTTPPPNSLFRMKLLVQVITPPSMAIDSVEVKLSLCFFLNWAPRHEGVWGNGGIPPCILWPRH